LNTYKKQTNISNVMHSKYPTPTWKISDLLDFLHFTISFFTVVTAKK
jgi:hypothetical protein